mgnify:CR=1 FL=1
MAVFSQSRQALVDAGGADILLHFACNGGRSCLAVGDSADNIPARAAMTVSLPSARDGSVGQSLPAEPLAKVVNALERTLQGEAIGGTRYSLWKVIMAVAELTTNDLNKTPLLDLGVVPLLAAALNPRTIDREQRSYVADEPGCFAEATRRLAFAKGFFHERLSEHSSLLFLVPDLVPLVFASDILTGTSTIHVLSSSAPDCDGVLLIFLTMTLLL